MNSLLNINKSQKQEIFCSFLQPKMLPLAGFKVPLQSEMTYFPALSYSWNSKFPTLPYKPEKGNSLEQGLPLLAIIGTIPPGILLIRDL